LVRRCASASRLPSQYNTDTHTTVWEYYGNDQAVIDSPGYPGIAGLADVIASDSTILHVSFRDAPEPALAAPTTEVSVMTLKSGKTFADFDAALASIAPKVELEVGSVAWTWGETKEDAEKLVLFFGWESSKVRIIPFCVIM
jgi:hypothetical protein